MCSPLKDISYSDSRDVETILMFSASAVAKRTAVRFYTYEFCFHCGFTIGNSIIISITRYNKKFKLKYIVDKSRAYIVVIVR